MNRYWKFTGQIFRTLSQLTCICLSIQITNPICYCSCLRFNFALLSQCRQQRPYGIWRKRKSIVALNFGTIPYDEVSCSSCFILPCFYYCYGIHTDNYISIDLPIFDRFWYNTRKHQSVICWLPVIFIE